MRRPILLLIGFAELSVSHAADRIVDTADCTVNSASLLQKHGKTSMTQWNSEEDESFDSLLDEAVPTEHYYDYYDGKTPTVSTEEFVDKLLHNAISRRVAQEADAINTRSDGNVQLPVDAPQDAASIAPKAFLQFTLGTRGLQEIPASRTDDSGNGPRAFDNGEDVHAQHRSSNADGEVRRLVWTRQPIGTEPSEQNPRLHQLGHPAALPTILRPIVEFANQMMNSRTTLLAASVGVSAHSGIAVPCLALLVVAIVVALACFACCCTASRQGVGSRAGHPRPKASLTAPTFRSTGWEAEVEELLEQITPTPACEMAVAEIARRVQEAVQPLYPGAEVVGYVNGNLSGGKAFGVAVPDVDIVISVCPEQLSRRTQQKKEKKEDGVDSLQVQKAAIRACMERLVNSVGLKFRRSAFRGREPKVTFLVPASLGIHAEAIPMDLSLNTLIPSRNAALLQDLSAVEPRVKALVLLVKRWAKDRGICHAAKGHLPPCVWTYLCIYYLQTGVKGGALLAPLEEARTGAVVSAKSGASAAELFVGFIQYYACEFDWCYEAVSVRLGQRAPPDPALPAPIAGDDGTMGPFVEDPFDQECNLGDGMTKESRTRLHEELSRAHALCGVDASLSVLLQPWMPPTTDQIEDAMLH